MQTDATLLANNFQHCWMLHVASVCTPCCMLLDVIACCCAKFETGQTFQPTTPNISFVPWSPKRTATMLDPFAQLFQHCWDRARALRMVYKDLWVVSFPRCTADPNNVGSCCVRFHAALASGHICARYLRIVSRVVGGVVTRAVISWRQQREIFESVTFYQSFSGSAVKKLQHSISNPAS